MELPNLSIFKMFGDYYDVGTSGFLFRYLAPPGTVKLLMVL